MSDVHEVNAKQEPTIHSVTVEEIDAYRAQNNVPEWLQNELRRLHNTKYKRVVIYTADDQASVNDLIAKAEKIDKIRFVNALPVTNTATGEQGLPEGYAGMMLPVSQRVQAYVVENGQRVPAFKDEAKTKPKLEEKATGLVLCAVPTTDMLLNSPQESHRQFVIDAVEARLGTKASNSINKENLDVSDLPQSTNDWVESARGEALGDLFDGILKNWVAALKANELTVMRPDILRSCLRDANLAASQFQHVPAEIWVDILDNIITEMQAKGGNVSVLLRWKEERFNRGTSAEIKEITLDSLMAAIPTE